MTEDLKKAKSIYVKVGGMLYTAPILEELFLTDEYARLSHNYAISKLKEREQYYQDPTFRRKLRLLLIGFRTGGIQYKDYMEKYCNLMQESIHQTKIRQYKGLMYILEKEGTKQKEQILQKLKEYGISKNSPEITKEKIVDEDYEILITALDAKNKEDFLASINLKEDTIKIIAKNIPLLKKVLNKKFGMKF